MNIVLQKYTFEEKTLKQISFFENWNKYAFWLKVNIKSN